MMRELSETELSAISGGASFLKVVGGAVFGAITGGFMGFVTGGPVGAIAGAGYGAYMGTAGTLIKEGAEGLVDTLHPEFNQ
jgi:bacteriocin-like protein